MKTTCVIICIYFAIHSVALGQHGNHVKIVGQMKDVMWNGQLNGKIFLDTIADKTNLYGIGPVEYLTGEILIIDGRCYRSTVETETSMRMEETYDIHAAFFGYAQIKEWHKQVLPDSIQTLHQLEAYINKITSTSSRPFIFKITGKIDQAMIHVVNLPGGTKVKSPTDAHKGKVNYEINNEWVEMVGFFSTSHQAIFTHHDTYLHIHLITADRMKMGHLDELNMSKDPAFLYLPVEKNYLD